MITKLYSISSVSIHSEGHLRIKTNEITGTNNIDDMIEVQRNDFLLCDDPKKVKEFHLIKTFQPTGTCHEYILATVLKMADGKIVDEKILTCTPFYIHELANIADNPIEFTKRKNDYEDLYRLTDETLQNKVASKRIFNTVNLLNFLESEVIAREKYLLEQRKLEK